MGRRHRSKVESSSMLALFRMRMKMRVRVERNQAS